MPRRWGLLVGYAFDADGRPVKLVPDAPAVSADGRYFLHPRHNYDCHVPGKGWAHPDEASSDFDADSRPEDYTAFPDGIGPDFYD